MIDMNIPPHQLLVLDDNIEWLSSLSALGIATVCYKKMANRTLMKLIADVKEQTVFIINKNLMPDEETNRSDLHGKFIVDNLLKPFYPKNKYLFLSFRKDSADELCYIDFLQFINRIPHERPSFS
jgi:hypothetical protein